MITQLEFLDIMNGEQKAPAFVAMNPMGKLPDLRDGDAVVTEAAAIATRPESSHPRPTIRARPICADPCSPRR